MDPLIGVPIAFVLKIEVSLTILVQCIWGHNMFHQGEAYFVEGFWYGLQNNVKKRMEELQALLELYMSWHIYGLIVCQLCMGEDISKIFLSK